jgi:6-phosphogluconolactonase
VSIAARISSRLQDWQSGHFPDIAILGMGTDGHFASLFPAMMDDERAFDLAADPAVITTAPMGHPLCARITMNLSMILAIPNRVLMVVGEEKKAVLSAALNGEDLPITRLLAHDGTQIYHERI